MSRIKPDWACPSCGATADSKTIDCCDACILTLFSGVHSPDLNTAFEKYNSTHDWVDDSFDYEEED
jgi:NMD protein affecting ribosome stability and mRNA decay